MWGGVEGRIKQKGKVIHELGQQRRGGGEVL